MATRQDKGRLSESTALEFLQNKGLEILGQNVRCPFGEIDLVARDGPTIVFVEVKSRYSVTHGLPQEALTYAKRRKLTRLAQWYLKRHRLERLPARFDVIAIIWSQMQPQVTWLVNAFEAIS
jgi:putative endonuclease